MPNLIELFTDRHKFIIRLLLCFLLCHHGVQAQTSKVGIFFTLHQFVTNTPSGLFEVEKSRLPVDLNIHSELVVVTKDSTYRFSFGQLYGYAIENDRYRAYGKKGALSFFGYYRVIDTAGVIVYSRNVRHAKSSSAPTYYFSKTLNEAIHELTFPEIKKTFPENKQFIEKVKPMFRTDYLVLVKKDSTGRTMLTKLYQESE